MQTSAKQASHPLPPPPTKPHRRREEASRQRCVAKQGILSFPGRESPEKARRLQGSTKILVSPPSPLLETPLWLLSTAGLKSKGVWPTMLRGPWPLPAPTSLFFQGNPGALSRLGANLLGARSFPPPPPAPSPVPSKLALQISVSPPQDMPPPPLFCSSDNLVTRLLGCVSGGARLCPCHSEHAPRYLRKSVLNEGYGKRDSNTHFAGLGSTGRPGPEGTQSQVGT